MNEVQVWLLMIPVMIVGSVLYLSPWWVRLLWPKVRYCFTKKHTIRAKLLELQAKHPYRMRDGGWLSLYDEEYFHTHYAIFKTEDGKQYTMTITKNQYQEMMQETTGLLTHKGNCFVTFMPEK